MHEDLDQWLRYHEVLFIHQVKEWTEILVQFETRNKYEVLDQNGTKLGWIAEKGRGVLKALSRQMLNTHRSMEVGVFNLWKNEILGFKRPFYWFFSKLTVYSKGLKVGSVHRRFSFFYKLYSLKDASGFIFAQIKAPLWRFWTFPIFDLSKNKIGNITKKWGGVLKEVFTDADRFEVQFPLSFDSSKRAVVLAAALSIDLDFFEKKK